MIVTIMNSVCPIRRGSRVGLIEFSEPRKTHVEFKFGRHSSVGAVHRAIDRVGYDDGKMNLKAVRHIYCYMLNMRVDKITVAVYWVPTTYIFEVKK